MLKLAHIVNPLIVKDPESDLERAQSFTIQTMEIARQRALSEPGLQVSQYAAFYTEDLAAVPTTWTHTPPLTRSVLDVVTPKAGEAVRKLPLLKDILDRLYVAAVDADYCIYTNIDIGLYPDFYLRVKQLLDSGVDALTIHRRTLREEYTSLNQLPTLFQDSGHNHPGFSCFIFPRASYTNYHLHNTCIGIQPVGVTLVLNMIRHAANHKDIKGERLTFHIGNDRRWGKTLLDSTHLHNERELDRLIYDHEPLEMTPMAMSIIQVYQRWRCDYVVARANGPLKFVYKLLRKIGFPAMIAAKYNKSERKGRN